MTAAAPNGAHGTGARLAVAELQRTAAAEASIDAIAARDVDSPEEIAAATRRWVQPLAAFMGPDEPSDDDREDWIIRDIIPRGEPMLWAGPSKAGKTWAALDLAIAVARGVDWLGGAHEMTMDGPGRVLVIALEDNARRLRSRVWELARGHGITPDDETLREHLSVSREPLRLAGDERRFTAELVTWRPCLVVIDNLTRVIVGDQNSIRDVAAFTGLWSRMCSDVGASVAFLHHMAKAGSGGPGSKERDPFDAIRGSGDLLAAARNAVVSMPITDAGESVSDVRIRGNLDLRRDRFALGFERGQDPATGKWSARLRDRGDPGMIRAALAQGRQAHREQGQRAKDEARRATALGMARTHGVVSAATLAPAIGVAPRTAAVVLSAMHDDGLLQRHRMGYRLPESQGGS